MSAFTDILKRLFTRNVVVARLPGNRLKAFDVNKVQSTGNSTTNTNRHRNRWRRTNTFRATSGYGYGQANSEIESLRKQMYLDYEMMDTDSIISSALDYYADECTTKTTDGQLLVIKTDDDNVKKILHNLFYDVLNIEFNLWSWIRTTCKYGDFMLYLHLAEKYGVTTVTPIHPGLMIREEGIGEDIHNIRFKYEGDIGMQYSSSELEQYEIAHFRLMTDTNFLPYGRSIIEPTRKEYKKLVLMEDAMLLNRIMRAPERRLFKIEVGNLAPEEVDSYIEEITREMKKTPYIDPETGDYNIRYNLQSMLEDYFLPVRGGDSGTTIETLDGLKNEGQIQDVDYIKDKVLASLKIPKSFLGFGEESGGKANLASEDIRFARTIERVQKIFVSELYKIAFIHLKIQGFDNEELLNFELELNSPSIIYERQKVDLMNEKINLVTNIRENNLFSDKYIYENIFGLTEDVWQAEKDRIIEDLKEQFRREQIKSEGNDPKTSGRSFGTPHDIASLQMSSKFNVNDSEDMKRLYSPDERANNEGQPKKFGSFETKRDKIFGRDPLGKRDIDSVGKKGAAENFLRYSSHLDKFKVKKSMLSEELLLDTPI